MAQPCSCPSTADRSAVPLTFLQASFLAPRVRTGETLEHGYVECITQERPCFERGGCCATASDCCGGDVCSAAVCVPPCAIAVNGQATSECCFTTADCAADMDLCEDFVCMAQQCGDENCSCDINGPKTCNGPLDCAPTGSFQGTCQVCHGHPAALHPHPQPAFCACSTEPVRGGVGVSVVSMRVYIYTYASWSRMYTACMLRLWQVTDVPLSLRGGRSHDAGLRCLFPFLSGGSHAHATLPWSRAAGAQHTRRHGCLPFRPHVAISAACGAHDSHAVSPCTRCCNAHTGVTSHRHTSNGC